MKPLIMQSDEVKPIKRKKIFFFFVTLYAMLFFSANFVGDHLLRLFYFNCSTGTLLIQFAFAGIILFSEMLDFSKVAKIIIVTSGINLGVAFLAYYGWQLPIPGFWVEQNIDSIETLRQVKIIFFLSLSYASSALIMAKMASILRKWFEQGWLLLRIFLVTLIGLIADTLFLTPILLLVASNNYMAFWMMLTLVSIKLLLSMLILPAIYGLLLAVKEWDYHQGCQSLNKMQ